MEIGLIKAGFVLAVSALFIVITLVRKYIYSAFTSHKEGKGR